MTEQPNQEPSKAPFLPRVEKTPMAIRDCLLPEDLPVFDAELVAACREVAEYGTARLEAFEDVLSRWLPIARQSQDPDHARAVRDEVRRLQAGEATPSRSWREVAAAAGIPVDADGSVLG